MKRATVAQCVWLGAELVWYFEKESGDDVRAIDYARDRFAARGEGWKEAEGFTAMIARKSAILHALQRMEQKHARVLRARFAPRDDVSPKHRRDYVDHYGDFDMVVRHHVDPDWPSGPIAPERGSSAWRAYRLAEARHLVDVALQRYAEVRP